MQLKYNNKDITENVAVLSASIFDNAGGKADSCKIILSDIEKQWRKYPPLKGDMVSLIYKGFNTGAMYIDEFHIKRGKFVMKARSTGLQCKESKSRTWENVRFKKVASDLCKDVGLAIEFYNVTDWLYSALNQINKSNLSYLNELCILEGYRLKINDNRAIIYDEKSFEKTSPVNNYEEMDFIGDYDFPVSNNLYSSCEIISDGITGYFEPTTKILAPKLFINTLPLRSYSEGERFSKNILRHHNKHEYQGYFKTRLNDIAAGSTIRINLDCASGIYFVEEVEHNLSQDISSLKVRKVLDEFD